MSLIFLATPYCLLFDDDNLKKKITSYVCECEKFVWLGEKNDVIPSFLALAPTILYIEKCDD